MTSQKNEDQLYMAYFLGVTSAVRYLSEIIYNDKLDDGEKVFLLVKKYDHFYETMNSLYLDKDDKRKIDDIRRGQIEN